MPIRDEEMMFTPMSRLGHVRVNFSPVALCSGAVEVHTVLDDSTAVVDL